MWCAYLMLHVLDALVRQKFAILRERGASASWFDDAIGSVSVDPHAKILITYAVRLSQQRAGVRSVGENVFHDMLGALRSPT